MLKDLYTLKSLSMSEFCTRGIGLKAFIIKVLIMSLSLMSPVFAEEGSSGEQPIIENINADFIGQNAELGGAIYNENTIENIKGAFIGNSAGRNGGAIFNLGHIGQIVDSKFINNTVRVAAVSPSPMLRMTIHHNINAINRSGVIASAIYNAGEINEIVNSSFVGNSVIYPELTETDSRLKELENMQRAGLSLGGNNPSQIGYGSVLPSIGAAVYTNQDLSIVADNGVSEFSGNYFQNSNGEKDYVAIYVDSIRDSDMAEEIVDYNNNMLSQAGTATTFANINRAGDDAAGLEVPGSVNSLTTLSLIAKNKGKIIVNDKISGSASHGNLQYEESRIRDTDMAEEFTDGDESIPSNRNRVLNSMPKTTEKLSEGYKINDAENGIAYKLNIDGDATGVVQINNNVEAKGQRVIGVEILEQAEQSVLSLLDGSPSLEQSQNDDMPQVNRSGDDAAGLSISEKMREQITENENITGIVDISLSNTNLHLGVRDNVLDGNNLTLNSGVINMVNNQAGVSALHNLTIAGNTSMVADVDLANKSMDRFTSETYGEHKGMLTVAGMNLLSDSRENRTEIFFAEAGLKDNVANAVTNLPASSQTSAFTPIYKYDVNYDNRNDGGFFVFTRGSNKSVDSFNPAVLPTAVANQTGAYTTQNQTFNYAFQNSDNFMNIPYLERLAIKNQNKYALSPNGDATDVGAFSPIFTKPEGSSVWVKPYASFENVPLKNGPKVDNINYGTLVGFDSDLKEVRGGFDRVMTYYLGYNGSYQSYRGVNSTQNGGLVGTTATFYKGNFFNATTLSVGASVGDNDTMYGHEDFALLLAGIGNKTGYNLEFKDGRIILQPNLLLSYTFVNTFDYTNAAGIKIKSDPLNAIQIAPGVKLIGNTKSGWQPYASVSMVWNLLDKSKVTADDVRLPEMSIKPYVQYGLGVQKRFKDRFLGFGQAMVQNGGRNGVSLSFGLRMMLGK